MVNGRSPWVGSERSSLRWAGVNTKHDITLDGSEMGTTATGFAPRATQGMAAGAWGQEACSHGLGRQGFADDAKMARA